MAGITEFNVAYVIFSLGCGFSLLLWLRFEQGSVARPIDFFSSLFLLVIFKRLKKYFYRVESQRELKLSQLSREIFKNVRGDATAL